MALNIHMYIYIYTFKLDIILDGKIYAAGLYLKLKIRNIAT